MRIDGDILLINIKLIYVKENVGTRKHSLSNVNI